MAHDRRQQSWSAAPATHEQEQWQELRDELEDLLDQISLQQEGAELPSAGRGLSAHGGLPERYSPGRNRQSAALRSVQDAMNRVAEQEEVIPMPVSTRQGLHDAIDQIRSSRAGMRRRRPEDGDYGAFDRRTRSHDRREWDTSERRSRPSINANLQYEELGAAISDIAARLERFDELLGSSSVHDSHLNEVAVQIEQLTSIVEVLAERVNERTAFESIENQIASLSDMVNKGRTPDLAALESRLDGLSSSFERLTKLQAAAHADLKAERENSMARADAEKHYGAIEQGVRNIYERLDSLGEAGAPDDIGERIAELLERFDRLEGQVAAPEPVLKRLAELERALNTSQPGIDLGALRTSVDDALAERLMELDAKIGGIANGLKSRAVKLETSPQLEDQIRSLSTRLEETSRELSKLRLSSPPTGDGGALDISALADQVAERTSAQLADVAKSSNDATRELLSDFETRLNGMVDKASAAATAPDLGPVEQALKSVGGRLAKLEQAVIAGPAQAKTVDRPAPDDETQSDSGFARIAKAPDAPSPDEPSPSVDDDTATDSALRPPHPGLERDVTMSHAKSGLKPQTDSMPRSPAEDAPLNAPAFPPPAAARADKSEGGDKTLPAEMRDKIDAVLKSSGARDTADDAETNDTSEMPKALAEEPQARPPAPKSRLGGGAADPAAISSAPTPPAPAAGDADRDAQAINRSTFIAAARRAAQANNPVIETESESLIGRALSRFQRKKSTEAGAEPDPDDARMEEPDEETGVAPQLGADDTAEETPRRGRFHARRQARKEAERAAFTAVEDEIEALDEDEIGDEYALSEPRQSFLARHSRPILLVLALIAVSLMTLNLVSQRLGNATGSADVASTESGPSESIVDPSPVGSIDVPESEADSLLSPNLSMPLGPVRTVGTDGNGTIVPSVETVNFQTTPAVPAMPLAPAENLGPLELREAARAGDPRAQYEIAAVLAEGRTVDQDLAQAAQWYEHSALQGFAPAAYVLANMLENGTGVDADMDKALYWYQRSADAGNRMSMHNMAAMHASGAFGQQDFVQAAFWFERAAALGLTDSQFNLGMLYARGLGVPQDLESSFFWFSIAAEGGDADAAGARDDVARSLDADAVTRLQADIANWAPQQIDISANFAPIGTWTDTFDPGATIENQDVVRTVQAVLNKLGYDAGTADGLMGPKTRDAIAAFETETGMSTSGEVNPRLLAVLASQPV